MAIPKPENEIDNTDNGPIGVEGTVSAVPSSPATALYGAISVTSTPIEVKVGGSPLTGRQYVTVQPTNGDVYYGYTNAVTTSTGTRVFKNQFMPIEAKDTLTVYLVSSGTVNTRITEVGA